MLSVSPGTDMARDRGTTDNRLAREVLMDAPLLTGNRFFHAVETGHENQLLILYLLNL